AACRHPGEPEGRGGDRGSSGHSETPSVCNTFYLHPSAVPPFFQEEMTSQEGVEGGTATLHCELSKAPACVQWRKGQHILTSGSKYSMRQEGRAVELLVHGLDLSDSGDYSCVCGDQTSTAALTVHGNVIPGGNVLPTCPNLYGLLLSLSVCLESARFCLVKTFVCWNFPYAEEMHKWCDVDALDFMGHKNTWGTF
uniref:Ig-like domain-containing protein n=1 Tax=Serinus canaria TaxID=9135 RepID=A0A8C9MTH8_SERCA